MNVAALVSASCAAIYVVIGFSYVRLASIRRLGGEYGFFASLAFGLAVACIGALTMALAADTAGADRALRIETLGAAVSFGAVSNFVYPNVERPIGLPGHVATVFTMSVIALVLGGTFFDPGTTIPLARSLGPLSYPQPALTPAGVVFSLGGSAIAMWVAADVARYEWTSSSGRLVFLTVSVGIVNWTIVTLLRALGYASGPSYGIVLTPFMIALGASLLRRWVDVDEELARRSDQLTAAYVELKEAQNELVRREQLAAVGELSAVIAHEVRNPLAVLKNAVSGLRRDNLPEDIRETLHGILDQETDRLNRLVRDLLSYARPIHLTKVEVPIGDLVTRVVENARAASETSSDIDVELDLDLPASIRADADLLERALAHVVENALQAMPGGGKLVVLGRKSVEADRRVIILSVIDTGEGMDTLVRSRAKEPFFTTRQQGTGLGLAIVERVASAHGGRLELDRNSEGGSRVTLVIPEGELSRSSHPELAASRSSRP